MFICYFIVVLLLGQWDMMHDGLLLTFTHTLDDDLSLL